jgi:hypothetical protein
MKTVKVKAYKKVGSTGKIQDVDAHLRKLQGTTKGIGELSPSEKGHMIYTNPNVAFHELVKNKAQNDIFNQRRKISLTMKEQSDNDIQALLSMLQDKII